MFASEKVVYRYVEVGCNFRKNLCGQALGSPGFQLGKKTTANPDVGTKSSVFDSLFFAECMDVAVQSDIRTLPYLCKYTNAQNFVQKS